MPRRGLCSQTHTTEPNTNNNSKNCGRDLYRDIWGKDAGGEGSPGISALVHFPYEPLHNTAVPSRPTAINPAVDPADAKTCPT